MALRVSKKSIPVVLFAVMLAALVGPVVPATVNYLAFYPSLSKIETAITEVRWATAPSSANITMKIVLVSHGEYRGFSVVNLGGSVRFTVNGTEYRIGGTGAVGPTVLVPGQSVELTFRVSARDSLADLFGEWVELQENPVWEVDLSYEMMTFFSERALPMTYSCTYPGVCNATIGHIPSGPVGG